MVFQLVYPRKWTITAGLATLTSVNLAPKLDSGSCMSSLVMPLQFIPAAKGCLCAFEATAFEDIVVGSINAVHGADRVDGICLQD